MDIACLGHGNVGGAIAAHLHRLGHRITIATADATSARLASLRAHCPGLTVAAPAAAVQAAELVVLAVPFDAHQQALRPLRHVLAGKVLVDCTNPVGPGLTHGLAGVESGSERIQRLVPEARLVKAFSIYGFENFEQPPQPRDRVRPAMFFCGGDAAAKTLVSGLVTAMGWEPLDVGGLEQALALEHMTLLWIRMVRSGGTSAKTLWARLSG